MSRTTLAALAALAVLPALAFASAPRAARYEAYPAVGWRKVDEAEQKRLTRIAYGGKDYDSMMQVWIAKWKTGVIDEPYPEYSYRWADAEPHPELARLLPEVRFLGQSIKNNASTGPARAAATVLYKGKLYELRSFNKLLADYGFKFDTTEIPAVAKIAVLWTLMDQHAGNAFALRPDSAALATAIPAVTFKKIGWGQWQHPTHHEFSRKAVRIDLLVDGIARAAWMMPGNGNLVPMWLDLDGQVSTFYHGSEIKQPAEAPPAPQK